MFFRKKIKPQFMITIPEPCSEDWEKMHVVDDEHRHCDTCARTLTDFTKMSDDELALFFKFNNRKLGGRFLSEQLNRNLTPVQETFHRSTWWKAAILFPLTLFTKQSFAQSNDSIRQIDSAAVTQQDSLATDSLTVEKVVSDSVDVGEDTVVVIPTIPRESETIIYTIMTGDVTTSGCVVPIQPMVTVGWIPSPPDFKPEWYDPNGSGLLFAPEPETPDTLLDMNPNNLAGQSPERKPEAPIPATSSPWYEAILPSALRIRRKG